jgi:hypothetical protein
LMEAEREIERNSELDSASHCSFSDGRNPLQHVTHFNIVLLFFDHHFHL